MTQDTTREETERAPPLSQAGRRRLRRLVLGISFIAALFALWQVLTTVFAYTDDAYVTSDLIPIAPQVGGVIVSLEIADNQAVRKGDLLAKIDDTPFRLELESRKAALRAATAALAIDQGNPPVSTDDKIGSGQIAEAPAAAERVSTGIAEAVRTAAVAEAQAAFKLAEWRLSQTEIRAPADGIVNNLTVGVGEMASAGRPLIGIVKSDAWRIVANYKENYVDGLKPGERAWVWIDTHPWRLYRARIEGVARGIGRSPEETGLLPYVAPTTGWIRLKRRFPVTLSLVDPPPDLTLYMGADARVLALP